MVSLSAWEIPLGWILVSTFKSATSCIFLTYSEGFLKPVRSCICCLFVCYFLKIWSLQAAMKSTLMRRLICVRFIYEEYTDVKADLCSFQFGEDGCSSPVSPLLCITGKVVWSFSLACYLGLLYLPTAIFHLYTWNILHVFSCSSVCSCYILFTFSMSLCMYIFMCVYVSARACINVCVCLCMCLWEWGLNVVGGYIRCVCVCVLYACTHVCESEGEK